MHLPCMIAHLFCANLLFHIVKGQDCVVSGKRCIDTPQCCGGCCVAGYCIDTYESCSTIRHPCEERYCPGGMNCEIFKPENCPECDIQTICV